MNTLSGIGDVQLAEALEFTATRFRATGVMLAVLDGAGRVLAHDEGAPPERARPLLEALRADKVLAGQGPVSRAGPDGLQLLALPVPATAQRTLVCAAATDDGLTAELFAALAPAVHATFVDQLSICRSGEQIDNVTDQLSDSYEELSLLYRVTGGMIVTRDPEDFFRNLCADVRTVLATRVMGVAFRPGRGLQSRIVITGDLDLDPPLLSRFTDETFELLVDRVGGDGELGQGTGGEGDGLVINDLGSEPHLAWLKPHFKQLLAVPLKRDKQVLGFLFAVDRDEGGFDSVDAKLLASVASSSAVYSENALLYDDVHGLVMGLLHALTSAVDAKDSYTCGHSHRVALLSRELAIAAGIDEYEVERVYIAGLLHDVGKIGVPEAVLSKCGKLTAEEFEQMKLHPQIGAKILADVRQVQDIIPGVLHHHERYDGRGYPNKLAGNDIPLLGRLICLADSFDAMTSNRTYRPGMPLATALAEITKCAGQQFDPALAELFVGLGEARLAEIVSSHRSERAPAFPLRRARAA